MKLFRKSCFAIVSLALLAGCGGRLDTTLPSGTLGPHHHSTAGVTHVMPVGDSLTVGWIDWGILSAGYRENLYKALNAYPSDGTYDFVGYYNGIKTKNADSTDGLTPGIDNHNEGQNGDRIIDMRLRLTNRIPQDQVLTSSGAHVTWYNDTAVNQEPGSGTTTLVRSCYDQGLNKIQCFQPGIVLLMAGSNDMPKDDHSTADARLGELIDLIYGSAPKARIYVASLPPTAVFAINQRISSYNAKIEKMVAHRRDVLLQNIEFVPIHKSVTTRDLYKDGAHYTKVGYCKMANMWIQTMSEIKTKTTYTCK